ncbi:SDR family NAD(P)-dependent oxidoreductase [Streptomyces goshikiensis]|uniref:SDR family NAD(P)-dependent oxidoreductase n=1 Tax=Streptomyces goshikiensis TaxID=1942 RepID=UPI0033FE9EAE
MTATGRFAGRVALVCGPGDGVSRATALAFAREGAAVLVAGPDGERLAGTALLVRDAGGQAASVVADVVRDGSDAAARMVAAAVERFGVPDFVFNDASVTGPRDPGNGTGTGTGRVEVDWAAAFAAHLTGLFTAMRHELAPMTALGRGVIVNTVRATACTERLIGPGAYAGYSAALATLTATAAHESAALGVRISLAGSRTGSGSGSGSGSDEELAEQVLLLCADEND